MPKVRLTCQVVLAAMLLTAALFTGIAIAQGPPALEISKGSDKPQVQPGESLVYTIQFTNTSPVTATNVIVIDILPPGMEPVVGDEYYDAEGRRITWEIGELPPGQAVTQILQVIVDSDAPSELINEVKVQADGDLSASDEALPVAIIQPWPMPALTPTLTPSTLPTPAETLIPADTPSPTPTEMPTPTPTIMLTPTGTPAATPSSAFISTPTPILVPTSTRTTAQEIRIFIRENPVPFIGGIVGIVAVGLVLAGIMISLTRPGPEPPPILPYLECPDRSVEPRQLTLSHLGEAGEVIGRAMESEGITLHIDETFPRWETVSRHHARIYRDPATGRVVIEDTGSQNGVYVQGRRAVRNLLKDGWVVAIGGVEFVYREPQAGSDQLPLGG